MVPRRSPETVIVTPPVPDWVIAPMPALGPALIRGALEARGHSCDLVDLTVRVRHADRFRWRRGYDLAPLFDRGRLSAHLERRQDAEISSLVERLVREGNLDRYEVVGFSIFVDQSIPAMLCLAKRLKQVRRPPKILVGGPVFERSDFRYLLDFGLIDGIVVGDGEPAMLAAVEGSDGPVPGLIEADTPESVRTKPASIGLAEMAPPVFDAGDIERYRELGMKGGVWLPYLFTRGCRYRCSFCRDYANVSFDYTPVGKMVDDMERLKRDHGVDAFYFAESNINNSPEAVTALCEEILRRRLRIRWGGLGTIAGFELDTIELMARAGCKHLHIGIETANQRLRDKWNLGKCKDLSAIEERLAAMHRHGVRVNSLWIVAFPHETVGEYEDSVSFFESVAPYLTTVGVSDFDLAEGSPAHMRQELFGIRARPSERDRYAFLDRHDAFDEVDGLQWEGKQAEADRKVARFERVARMKVGLPLALRMWREDPLYPVKRAVRRPYFDYDIFL